MKITVLFAVLAAFVSNAFAGDFPDTARVISVTPRTEQVNYPRQECRQEYSYGDPQGRGNTGAVIGGVAGGLLGSQVGGGNGRVAAAAAGAVIGAITGDRLENDRGGSTQQVSQRCYTVDSWQTRTVGYAVTYVYQGRTFSTVMSRDPGNRLPVRVSVMPEGY